MTPAQQTEPFRLIPIAALRESPWNPRQRFTEAALAELTESIRKHGVMAPLIVRPFAGEPGTYEIAAGHRRYRAGVRAELAELPAIVREMTDEQFLDVLTIENLQREDLHPLEEAAGYHELMERASRDVETIAAKVGKSASYVYQRLKLLDLAEPVREAFWADRLTAGHAVLLARLQPKDQARGLKEIVDRREWQQPLSVRDLTEWIEREVHRDLAVAVFPVDDATLVPAAGACTACPKRTLGQPILFPDAKRDECLDPACYKGKGEALKARNLTAHPDAIKVTERWSATKGDGKILSRERWDPIPAGKTAKPGESKTAVVVDGPKAGQVVQVRVKPAAGGASTGSPSGAAARKNFEEEAQRRRERVEREEKLRLKVLEATLARVKGVLRAADLRLIATELLVTGACDGTDFVRRRRGWGFTDDKVKKDVLGMNEVALGRLLLELVLGGYVEVSLHEPDGASLPPALLQAAKYYSVDTVAIEREVLAAGEPKKPAKPKPAAKKVKPAAKKGKKR